MISEVVDCTGIEHADHATLKEVEAVLRLNIT